MEPGVTPARVPQPGLGHARMGLRDGDERTDLPRPVRFARFEDAPLG
jgi:hypothetical protein